ncbi:hypothetical protein GPN2_22793 [Streptomyces murinus]
MATALSRSSLFRSSHGSFAPLPSRWSAPKANTRLYDKGQLIRSFTDVRISTRSKGTDGYQGPKVAPRPEVIELHPVCIHSRYTQCVECGACPSVTPS